VISERAASWRVTTWNVLHRIHAVNWAEAAIAQHADERARVAAIARAVAAQLEGGVRVCCLQEVSGDQLRSLQEHLPAGVVSFHHRYARVPRLRREGVAGLDDPSEQLVTLVRGTPARAREIAAQTFASDPGKGFLGVDLGDGCVVWNAHVTWRERGVEQLRELGAVARSHPGTAVMTGDFNTDAAAVRAALGADVQIADLEGQRPTRAADGESAGKSIDHVVALRGRVEDARVLDGEGLSDHHPVTARVVAEG
jgi:endonuclease/exonuclease/phosphatase family metal-dependent hydrolase